MQSLSIGQILDHLDEQYERIKREMNAIPNLDNAGIPLDPTSPEGRKWDELFQQMNEISHQMCELVITHTPGQKYPDPEKGE